MPAPIMRRMIDSGTRFIQIFKSPQRVYLRKKMLAFEVKKLRKVLNFLLFFVGRKRIFLRVIYKHWCRILPLK